MASQGAVGGKGLQSIFHHVFLPPRLPSGEDDRSWESALLDILVKSLQDFETLERDSASRRLIESAVISIQNFRESQTDSGLICEEKLKPLLASIKKKGELEN
jgi:hypothetical protein